MIELRHLRKEFGSIIPFKDINAKIFDGDVISIIGPSGTGKSTLLRCINMLTIPTSGQVIIDGVDITDSKNNINIIRQKIGMVFQSFNLYEHLTIIENIMLAQTKLQKKSRQEAYDIGMDMLEKVGLKKHALYYPSNLSGGQKQRAAIARTLATNPSIILFDEPTSALDPLMVNEVENIIKKIADDGHTMMIVTHEMNFAKKIANRVFYLDEGGIYEEGTPTQIFENPQKEKTKNFIFHLSNLEIDVTNDEFDYNKAIDSILEFGEKHKLGAKRLYRLQIVFEELCITYLKKYMEKDNLVHVVISYIDDKDRLTMKVGHNIASRVGLTSGDDIIKSIITNYALNIKSVDENNKTVGMLEECELEF